MTTIPHDRYIRLLQPQYARRLLLTLVACVALPSANATEPLTGEAAQRLLRAAMENECSAAISFEIVKTNGDKTTTEKHFQKRGMNGGLLLRIERITVAPHATYQTLDIANETGYWTIINDAAIRMPDRTNEAVAAGSAFRKEQRNKPKEKTAPRTFAGEVVEREGRRFAVVTNALSEERHSLQVDAARRFAAGGEAIAPAAISKSQADYRRNKELGAIGRKVPAKYRYVIDLERSLVVEEVSYNSEGAVLRQRIRDNLRLEKELPEFFFEVPSHCKKYFPASFSAYSSLRRKEKLAEGAAWRKNNKTNINQQSK